MQQTSPIAHLLSLSSQVISITNQVNADKYNNKRAKLNDREGFTPQKKSQNNNN